MTWLLGGGEDKHSAASDLLDVEVDGREAEVIKTNDSSLITRSRILSAEARDTLRQQKVDFRSSGIQCVATDGLRMAVE